jgi:spore coat protein U-like protein
LNLELFLPMKNAISPAVIAAAGALMLGLSSTAANAATAINTTFNVTANVQATCLIAATPLNFGTYDGTLNNKTSNVNVTCTNTTPYNVGLDAGTASGATVTTRKMVNGANTLSYSLFSDSAETKNWGNTIGTDTVTGTGNGTSQALTVYGQIPASQYVTPATYSDTITATLTY